MEPLWILAVVVAFVVGWRCGLVFERACNSIDVEFLSGLLRKQNESERAYLDRGPIEHERGNDNFTLH